jgi:hypothetical protein
MTNRFLDLAEVCPDLEHMMLLHDHLVLIDCPDCIEGWVPDPNSTDTNSYEIIPGVMIVHATPVPCGSCGGSGEVFWTCTN